MTILFADIHAGLDDLKAPKELIQHRAKFYEFAITSLLRAVGVSTDQLRFVLGSSFQSTPPYVLDIYRLSTIVSDRQARKAGSEVVKGADSPALSGLLYPLMQVLDEDHLDCDVQFGGQDQRKLFAAAAEWLPKLGRRKASTISDHGFWTSYNLFCSERIS